MLTIDERLGVPVALAYALSAALQMAVPASHWLDVRAMDVHDGQSPLVMTFDRTIQREFDGLWRVKLWRVEDGSLSHVCTTPAQSETYRPEAKLPEPVTLEWFAWTDARCYDVPPGCYEIEATWEINPGSVIWHRSVQRRDQFCVGAEHGA